MTYRYCLHGVTVLADVEIASWPQGERSDDEWRLAVDDEASHLAGLVRSGEPQWQWEGDVAVADGHPLLTLTGGSGRGSATTFEIDWSARSINVAFTHADADGFVGTVELVNRWVLPVIARHEADVVPLHATSLDTAHGAIVVAGDSGVGKSTLTAALCEAGATLLGDEPVIVEPLDAGGSRVWPGEPAIRLADTRAAGPIPPGLRLAMSRFGKSVLVPDELADGSRPAPLAALCLLAPRSQATAPLTVEVISGPQRVAALMDLRYTNAGGAATARRDFRVVSAIAASSSPVVRVRVPDDRDRVGEAARHLLAMVDSPELLRTGHP